MEDKNQNNHQDQRRDRGAIDGQQGYPDPGQAPEQQGSEQAAPGSQGSGGQLDNNGQMRDDDARARQMEQQSQVDRHQRAGDETSQQGQGAGRSDKE